MTAALARRVEKLEAMRGIGSRPTVAFVIWERTKEAALATLERALASGAVKHGDPIVLGTIAEPGPLPAMRWTDALNMSDDELEAMASLPGTSAPGRADVRTMSDAELSDALIRSVASPAA
jgi:hypothetical protein